VFRTLSCSFLQLEPVDMVKTGSYNKVCDIYLKENRSKFGQVNVILIQIKSSMFTILIN
jgi:hypothetical protein